MPNPGIMKPLFIELFSGSKTTANEFEAQGFETFTVDIEEDFNPDLVKDIFELTIDDLEHLKLRERDLVVVWASPPCKAFSLANTSNHHFAPGGKPLTEDAHRSIELVSKTLFLIHMIRPKFWFLENPWTGFLRHQKFMKIYHMVKIYYCQYGSEHQKPTSIWGDFPSSWRPRSICRCKTHRSMWSDADFQGEENKARNFKEMGYHRAIVPAPLGREISYCCLNSRNRMFMTLEEWT